MHLRSKPLESVEESDLQRLVDDGAQEGDAAEFKGEMWGKSDEDRRKMLRSITSFANQKGGEIYVGIRAKDGTAVEAVGVEGEAHSERILSSCRSNVERPLQGLQVHPVPLGDGKSVIIVRVPYSLNGPHMVTFKGMNQFWIRHGRQKVPMTVDEIEDAFMRRFDSETRVERFIEERKQRAWNESQGDPSLFLAVTPAFLREEIIDPRDPHVHQLLSRPPEHPSYQRLVLGDVDVSPSLAGLTGEYIRDGRTIRRREVHRNGHVECMMRTFGSGQPPSDDERLAIPAKLVALQTHSFVHLARELYRHHGVASPVALSMAIFNARSLHLLYGGLFKERTREWGEDRLDLPLMYAQELESEAPSLVKRLNDRLWNAFRLDPCFYVTDEGDLTNIR